MDPPAGGAHDGRGLSAAISIFFGTRLGAATLACKTMDDFWRRRAARRRRLVDGVLGPYRRAGERVAIPAGVSSVARLRDLCRHHMDRAATGATDAQRCAETAARGGTDARRTVAAANLSGRAGGGAARRTGLQHLAAHRRRLRAG